MIVFSTKKKKINLKKKSPFSKGKFFIFQRKNLQNHILKEKSPMKKSSIKISKFLQKIKISKFFKKKNQSKFSIPWKNSRFPNFSKKKFKIFNSFEKSKFSKFKKKKSSLNSSSGTESYDPLPHSPVVQHQVNCPPLAFFEAWNMSQTRGIRQVCRILFNE